MKSASEFHRDSTRMYDLVKEYHKLGNIIKEMEDKFISTLPKSDSLFDNERSLDAWLRDLIRERMPEELARYREINAELDAMSAEQNAIIAAGWAANYELTQGVGVRQ